MILINLFFMRRFSFDNGITKHSNTIFYKAVNQKIINKIKLLSIFFLLIQHQGEKCKSKSMRSSFFIK